jgi:hypothetical protein
METSSRGMLSRALSNDFYLGADTGVDKFFCGMLDEVKIFKKALSLSEIENLI